MDKIFRHRAVLLQPHSLDPFRTIFYQILNNDGTVFLTNDLDPGYPTGDSGVILGSMVVGTSRGVQSFEATDIRNRSGGLASQWQSIFEAVNFWDLGSLDGKPRPLAAETTFVTTDTIL